MLATRTKPPREAVLSGDASTRYAPFRTPPTAPVACRGLRLGHVRSRLTGCAAALALYCGGNSADCTCFRRARAARQSLSRQDHFRQPAKRSM